MTAGHCGGSSAYTAGFGSSTRTSVTPFSISSVTRVRYLFFTVLLFQKEE